MRNRTLPTIARRNLVAGVLASFIAALPIFSARAKPADPDAELLALCAAYEHHKAAMIAEMDGGDDEVWSAEHEKMFAQVVEIQNTTPRTPAGLASKIRIIAESDGGGDEKVMRRLVADAAAVAGVA